MKRYQPFVIAGIVIVTIYVAVITWSYLTGTLALTENAKITELNVCLHENSYQPVTSILQDIDEIYACGKVEGTTSVHVMVDLIDDSLGRSLISRSARLWPGNFFVQLSPSAGFRQGTYRIQMMNNQKIVTETSFTVE
jgi:hypothetical protein